jgi:hypothetical protein
MVLEPLVRENCATITEDQQETEDVKNIRNEQSITKSK